MPKPSLEYLPQPLSLPDAPQSLSGPVKAWSEAIDLLTAPLPRPDKNPEFLQSYPLPVMEMTEGEERLQSWKAVHIENEFLRLMVLPELAGRVHLAIEKAQGREVLYREDAIRIDRSVNRMRGGLEIEFPSARPALQQIADTYIEEQTDGSRTIWCGIYDRASGLRSLHGICLYPGRAYVELKVRLLNRTQFAQPFSWSAIAGLAGCSQELLKTSPFAGSFSGGYCPDLSFGVLQITDGYSGEEHAFKEEAGYGELRSSLYSGLSPRVSALMPGETKSSSQFWYSFSSIGAVQRANADAAVSMTAGANISVGVHVTRLFPGASVVLETEGTILNRWTRDLVPSKAFTEEATLPPGIELLGVVLKVLTSSGRELISFSPSAQDEEQAVTWNRPGSSAELIAPRKIEALESLYLAGLRVQYRSDTPFKADEYWQEALRRDPSHAPSNNAIGLLQLKRGEFGEAEARFRAAIATVAVGQTDTRDGELFYNLGLTLRFQERNEEAYAAFQRASWDFGWRAAALHATAEIECKRRNFGVVPKFLYESLRLNADNNNARNLAAVLFRRFGRAAEAEQLVRESLILDPLDPWACQLAGRLFPGDNQTRLDIAFTYARAGLVEPAIELLTGVDTFARDGSLPMVHYTLAALYMQTGDLRAAQREYEAAASSPSEFCFPHRLDEMMVLARAIALQPEDAHAQYYLGCLLYHHGLPMQALEIWQSSAKLNEHFATVWRNLGVAFYNVTNEPEKALDSFDKAFYADPQDGQLLHERDQLWKLLGVPPTLRFREMAEHRAVAANRPSLSLELATLYNTNGEPENALELFSSQVMKGWERQPEAIAQYVRTFVKLGRKALGAGEPERARDLFLLALSQTSIAHDHPHAAQAFAELHFWLGEAVNSAGHRSAAEAYWHKAAISIQAGNTYPVLDEGTFFVALALGRIGERQGSRKLLRELWFGGRRMAREKVVAPAEASLFKRDVMKSQKVNGLLLQGQARVGLGQYKLAARLLEQLLMIDPNNWRALDLISDLEQARAAS